MTSELAEPQKTSLNSSLSDKAVALAEQLLITSKKLETIAEKREGAKLAALMTDPAGKELTFHLTDRILRSPDPKRRARLFRELLQQYGAPAYLPPRDRFLMILGAQASRFLPGIVMPAISARFRKESRDVILPADKHRLQPYLTSRSEQGAGVNLNLLGEAVLSETEARHRLEQNLTALTNDTTSYISVKFSAIFSQINLTAYGETRRELATRLRKLYRAAQTQDPPAFVNLDMEEYRDLHLTFDVFREVLDETEFLNLRAGIVLQAYLPDAHPLQRSLTAWAKVRHQRGGAPIKIRLVKGANLAMEEVDAELHHWPRAPYPNKEQVDANYKRMLQYACKPENAGVVNIGVASHNLFDLAYALVLKEENKLTRQFEIEMLEGMAPAQAKAVLEKAGHILFYAPVVHEDDFEAAIAYLIRRLDENTTDGNYLRDIFQINAGNSTWFEQQERFQNACRDAAVTPQGPQRLQDRNSEKTEIQTGTFANCPDTDFSLPQNRKWLEELLKKPHPEINTTLIGDPVLVEEAIQNATSSTWPQTTLEERAGLLRQCAVELAKSRADLIQVMNLEAKKAPVEGDVEVSEAIDFANYYAHSFQNQSWQDGLRPNPIGPIVITPPWNFPCAIPCGSILAALIAGNPVFIKPAPEVVATARVMTEALWRAGIPKDALQFLPLPDNEIGQSLITDPRITSVVLTGSSETASLFLKWRPDLALTAETSGKNSLVITSAADPDLAIKDLVKSAFGHSGQKCSAASVAIIERSLLENSTFLTRLREAASSLQVGPSSNPAAIVTPLVQEPTPSLLRGLTELDTGEKWLLEPQQNAEDPCLWSPGIRTGVKPNSWIHKTELFGPVLAVISFDTLEEAVAIQSQTSFGLTGGIHSLDPREIEFWKARVEVGNAYINRSITGAIVQRQPFGGWKKSSFGPGFKAGGPNYVSQFVRPFSEKLPAWKAQPSESVTTLLLTLLPLFPKNELETLQAAAENAAYWWRQEFSGEQDPSGLEAESNDFRYRPVESLTLRLTEETQPCDLALVAIMAATSRVPLVLSHQATLPRPLASVAKALDISLLLENDKQLSDRLQQCPLANLRTPGQPSLHLHNRNHHQPVTPHARLELLPFLLEQAISRTRHRHGRIVAE